MLRMKNKIPSPWNILYAAVAVILLFFLLTDNFGEGKSDELPFTLLHTNDEHSALLPHSLAAAPDAKKEENSLTRGGLARLASAIEGIREKKKEEGEPVLLFNAGDFLGGAAFGWLAPEGYAPEIKLLQEMEYDAALIGNHEFDFGPDILADYLLQAGYPEAHGETVLLSTNTSPPEAHPLAYRQLFKDNKLFNLENGLKIGVFGLIGRDAVNVIPDPGEVEFLDQHSSAREAVERLREKGADVIVAVTHSGLEEDRLLAREVPGIDVIVGGHCHTPLYEPVIEKETVIVQAGSLGQYLGRLELAYDLGTNEIRVRNEDHERSFLVPIDPRLDPHPEIDPLISEYKAKLDELVEELTRGGFEGILDTAARSKFSLFSYTISEESPAGNFITDAMRLVTEEVTGRRVDVAVQADGNIRGSIAPSSTKDSGENISLYDITGVTGLGFGDDGYPGFSLVSFYLTGEEIRRVLEVAVLLPEYMGDDYFLQFSGLRYSYNPQNTLLFTLPFIDKPIPTTRAVTEAELYTGRGIQPSGEGEYVPLERGDEQLYHIVTDTYVLSYLPMVGEILPRLEIVPKNKAGEPAPLENLSGFIIDHKNRELKVWEAAVKHASKQPPGEDGVPQIQDIYREPSGRINKAWSFPLVYWAYLAAAALIAATFFLARHRRK